jgi:hypothetical protein
MLPIGDHKRSYSLRRGKSDNVLKAPRIRWWAFCGLLVFNIFHFRHSFLGSSLPSDDPLSPPSRLTYQRRVIIRHSILKFSYRFYSVIINSASQSPCFVPEQISRASMEINRHTWSASRNQESALCIRR